MMKQWQFIAAGVLIAFIASAAGTPNGYEYYRFATRTEPKEREAEQIRGTIEFFSATIAGFYSIGGTMPQGLNLFPAENLVKRRIFQDINDWRDRGMLLVMDRDKSTVRQITFTAPDRAFAVVDENWFNVYQDLASRRPISNKKANFITVRYFLAKKWGKWIVAEYEVFPQGEALPPVPDEGTAPW